MLMNYNETRPSDVYVVNFGAHYKEYGEENEMFKKHTSALLDRMGEVSETATVVWRWECTGILARGRIASMACVLCGAHGFLFELLVQLWGKMGW